jgi:hypothetical protein
MLLPSLCCLIARPQYRLQSNQLVLNQRTTNFTSRFLQRYCRQLWLECNQRQPRIPLLVTLCLVLLASSCLIQRLQLLYKEDLLLSRGWKRRHLVLRQLKIRGRKAGENISWRVRNLPTRSRGPRGCGFGRNQVLMSTILGYDGDGIRN